MTEQQAPYKTSTLPHYHPRGNEIYIQLPGGAEFRVAAFDYGGSSHIRYADACVCAAEVARVLEERAERNGKR